MNDSDTSGLRVGGGFTDLLWCFQEIQIRFLAIDDPRQRDTDSDDAGLPDGVVNYMTGPGSEVGDEIMHYDEINAVSFTGMSTSVR